MMKGGLGNLLKQAQKMQEDMKEAQARLAEEEVTGEAGGGLVKVTMNGRYQVRQVEIDPSVVSGEDKEMLEDLVAAAVNAAAQKIAEKMKDSMSELTAGMPLPPGMKLPF